MGSEAQFFAVPQVQNFLNECITFLQTSWPTIASITLGAQNTQSPMNPINFANAASIGSCNTTCASAVVRNIRGVGGPAVNPFAGLTLTQLSAQFFSCGKNPAIAVTFPMNFPAGTLLCDIEVQGYSAFTTKQAKVLSILDVSNAVDILGSVVMNIPWSFAEGTQKKQTIYQNDLSLSAAVWPVWTHTIPQDPSLEETLRNIMNEAIQTALSETSQQIVNGLRGSVSNQLESDFVKAIPAITSWVPVLAFQMDQQSPSNAQCNSAQPFQIPPTGCAPCDLCCQCFVQQSCKGSCVDCSCLKCGNLRSYIFILFLVGVILVSAIFLREALLYQYYQIK